MAPSTVHPFGRWLDRVAVLKLRRTMLDCNGRVCLAARMLGMSRVTAYRLLQRDERRMLRQIASQDARDENIRPELSVVIENRS